MPARTRQHAHARRGGVYVAVLGSAMLVSLIGMSALAMVRAQRLTVARALDSDAARLYAESAVELGLQLIASDPEWRKSRTSGAWITNQAIGGGTLTIEGIDPVDGNLANRPSDPLTLRGTGRRGDAVQIVEVSLAAGGPALDALSMAIHTPGQLAVRSGATLSVSGAPASTNTDLANNGTIAGDAECLASIGLGPVTGKLTILAPNKPMPDSGVQALYTALGTAISLPGGTIENVVLAPGRNPWTPAATNADGVYVINSGSNITIGNCRIHGTLVINAPGRTVTIDNSVLIHPARADYPALIINADAEIRFTGGSGSLSEAAIGTNLNPAGAPYLGVTNSTSSDTYPSEIQGLVHVMGSLRITGPSSVSGAIICESAALSGAVEVSGNAQITYSPTLASSPPMGYTKAVSMNVQPGSWKRVVLP